MHFTRLTMTTEWHSAVVCQDISTCLECFRNSCVNTVIASQVDIYTSPTDWKPQKMRTRSQPQSPGGLVSLGDKPNKPNKPRTRTKRVREEEILDESPAKRMATATFLGVRARARANEEAQTKATTKETTPPPASTSQIETSTQNYSSHYQSELEPETKPQTPSQAPRASIFGSVFGSLSRSVSRIFTAEQSRPTNATSPEKQSMSSATQLGNLFDTPSQASFNRLKDISSHNESTPLSEVKVFQAKSEPRPKRSLFATSSTPRYNNTYRTAASARKPRGPIQQRQDPRLVKQHLWKLGWEGVPLNRITDPRSLKQREDEAREAGIDLEQYNIYDPGYEPIVQEEEDTNAGQKRKRPPLSPGRSIPNPPGSSYGMDLRYFDDDYDSDEDEDVADHGITPKQPKSAMKKPSENSYERFARSTKRVKFDNSPVDTPSKARARAKYTGIHFADTPNAFLAAEQQDQQPSPTPQKTTTFSASPAHPKPNTFCLPDDWSDESTNKSSSTDESSGMSGVSFTDQPAGSKTDMSTTPETPKKQPVDHDLSPLSKARQSVEKYKPKSPSTLRESMLTSTSPISDNSADEDNEFSKVSWPAAPTFADAGICDAEVADLLNSLWSPTDDIRAAEWFEREFTKFRAAELAALS